MNITTYTTITSIVTILIIIFLSLSYTKRIRKKKSELISFIGTIIATFIGVFFAIYFNNKAIINQEKDTTIKLLSAANNELNLIELEIDTRLESILGSNNSIKYEIANHHFPYPTIFPKTMQNDIILKNITGSSLRAMNRQWRNLAVEYDLISNPRNIMAYSDSTLVMIVQDYKQITTFSAELINNEIQYMTNNISREELEDKIDILYQRYNMK